ncbi:MAG: isochorismate synthase [Ktedonobacteraceae bacterium]|nr:isochorismate synthase [Ktedonobacteraceae bacterium]
MTNLMIVNDLEVRNAPWQESRNHDLIISTLQKAARQATQAQRGIVASITWPIELCDPLSIFTAACAAGLGKCFFWEHPAVQHALVGVGAATSIETYGSRHFTEAAALWRELLQDMVVTYAPGMEPIYGSGPTLFGGFAFDPLSVRTPLWDMFPDGLLLLPRILFSSSSGRATLTVNAVLQSQDDVEQSTRRIEKDIVRLFTAVAKAEQVVSEQRDEDQLVVQDIQPAAEWMERVSDTVRLIRQRVYEKVVLARSARVVDRAKEPFNVSATLHRLRRSYPDAYTFAIQRGERFFVGATPERLVQAQDGQLYTMALAGTAPRGTSEQEDEQLGTELLSSEKNNIEHAIVAATVREALLHFCSDVKVSDQPQLLKLKDVQHLKTPISGTLLPGCCILDIMAELHPTPAVGGVPREAALLAIRENEQLDRGWYAGPVGWIGARGHGEFAVALRSGLVQRDQATLFAGCGIVADSDPQAEYAESCLKLEVMLRGLGRKDREETCQLASR